MKYIYLGGPIAGLTWDEANQWRYTAQRNISTRDEFKARWPVLGWLENGEVYGTSGEYSNLTVDHDRWAVKNSDIILMNFTGAKKASIGCSVEFGWADAYRKPVVTILPKAETQNPHTHAFITRLSSVVVEDLDAALDIIYRF